PHPPRPPPLPYTTLFRSLGLNIPKVGWVMARNLAQHFGSVDRLTAATQPGLEEVEGIGPDRAELIAEWFADEENRKLVEELRSRSEEHTSELQSRFDLVC